MALPFSELRQHNQLVLKIYRIMLRNAFGIPIPPTHAPGIQPQEIRMRLLNKIQKAFKSNKQIVNSLVCQDALMNAVKCNKVLVDCFKTDMDKGVKWNSLLSFIGIAQYTSTGTNKKLLKNDKISERSDIDQILYDKKYQLAKLREEKRYNDTIKGYITEYLIKQRTANQISKKSKLDQSYINEILLSKIKYKKERRFLNIKYNKIVNDKPSFGVKSISGTYHKLAVINTPWNKHLHVEHPSVIHKFRSRHDECMLALTAFNEYSEKWEKLYYEEKQWEKQIKKLHGYSDGEGQEGECDWLWIFDQTSKDLAAKTDAVQNDVIRYNKLQHCYYDKLKNDFEQWVDDSKENMKRLYTFLDVNQVGEFTDVLENGDLTKNVEYYNFRSFFHKLGTLRKRNNEVLSK